MNVIHVNPFQSSPVPLSRQIPSSIKMLTLEYKFYTHTSLIQWNHSTTRDVQILVAVMALGTACV